MWTGLRLNWSHHQREKIPWYCTSPTETVPETWNTSRCRVVPKNVHMPVKIHQHGGPNLPCPQFKPIPKSESLAWESQTAAWISGNKLYFHTGAPRDIKHITKKYEFHYIPHKHIIQPDSVPLLQSDGAKEEWTATQIRSVHFLSTSDKLQHVGHSWRMQQQV